MKRAVDHLKKSDAILASIIARVGPCKMAYREPTFEMLARAIVFQQLSTKAARTIYGRLEEAAGGALTPQSIQNLSVGEMRRAGLSRQKLGYIRDLAEHAISGKVDFAKLPDMSDEEVIVITHRHQRRRRVDGAHVSDVFTAPAQRAAGGRSGRAHGDPARLSQAQACPRPSRLSRLPATGTRIAAMLRGICGEAWSCLRKNQPRRHGGTERNMCRRLERRERTLVQPSEKRLAQVKSAVKVVFEPCQKTR